MKFPTYERREDPRPCYPQETDGTPQGPKAYTALEMEAALCAWEFLMDNDVRSGCIGEIPDTATPFQKFISECMDGWGYAQMRYAARMLGTYIPRVYDAYEKAYGDYDDAYDWEFVPAVIKALPLEEVFEAGAYKREYAWPHPSDVVEVMGRGQAAHLAHSSGPHRDVRERVHQGRDPGSGESHPGRSHRVGARLPGFVDVDDQRRELHRFGRRVDLRPGARLSWWRRGPMAP